MARETADAARPSRDALELLDAQLLWRRAWGSRNPGWTSAGSLAPLVYHALGEVDAARALAAEDLDAARAFGAPRGIGIALRTMALVEDGPPESTFCASRRRCWRSPRLGSSSPGPWWNWAPPFDVTERDASARQPLRRGLEIAHETGGALVGERARAELLATGARPRRHRSTGREALTASELRVATLAARGPLEPRDRRNAVPEHEDGRDAPEPRLRQARHPLAHPARERPRRGRKYRALIQGRPRRAARRAARESVGGAEPAPAAPEPASTRPRRPRPRKQPYAAASVCIRPPIGSVPALRLARTELRTASDREARTRFVVSAGRRRGRTPTWRSTLWSLHPRPRRSPGPRDHVAVAEGSRPPQDSRGQG